MVMVNSGDGVFGKYTKNRYTIKMSDFYTKLNLNEAVTHTH